MKTLTGWLARLIAILALCVRASENPWARTTRGACNPCGPGLGDGGSVPVRGSAYRS